MAAKHAFANLFCVGQFHCSLLYKYSLFNMHEENPFYFFFQSQKRKREKKNKFIGLSWLCLFLGPEIHCPIFGCANGYIYKNGCNTCQCRDGKHSEYFVDLNIFISVLYTCKPLQM